MNQQCKVCGEPAAGFHFGAFTCEGCKSFFGRTYNNPNSISECKNNGECVINKKNRTACKSCRLRKCLLVGMSKSGSRYGRRSNWFKIHCLLQEQQQKSQSPPLYPLLPPALMPAAALAGYYKNNNTIQEEPRRSITPSDSGASSADPEDDNSSRSASVLSFIRPTSSPLSDKDYTSNNNQKPKETNKRKPSITLNIPLSPFGSSSSLPGFSPRSGPFLPALRTVPSGPLSVWPSRTGGDLLLCSPALAGVAIEQDQPIDLSIKSSALTCRGTVKNEECSDSEPELSIDLKDDEDGSSDALKTPLDLTLVSKRTEELPLTG